MYSAIPCKVRLVKWLRLYDTETNVPEISTMATAR